MQWGIAAEDSVPLALGEKINKHGNLNDMAACAFIDNEHVFNMSGHELTAWSESMHCMVWCDLDME